MREEHGHHQYKSKHSADGHILLCDNCAFKTVFQAKFDQHKAQAHGHVLV